MISVHGQNQVITLPIFGEIFLHVINDVVCPNRAHHVHIPRAAYAGDFSSKCFGNLHRKRPHTARCTIDQHLLSWLNVSLVAQTLQGGDCRHRDGRGFLERQPGGFQRDCLFRNRNILGKSAKATRGYVPEYLIPGLKLRDVAAHRFNPPREGRAEDLVFWFEKPRREAHQEWLSAQKMPVTRSGGCRKNFYQELTVRGGRFFYLFWLKKLR